MIRISTIFTILLLLCPDAYARELKVATWNLGWHLSKAEATTWIAKCSAPFQFNSVTRLWEPAESGTPGWELPWGRLEHICPAAMRRFQNTGIRHRAGDRSSVR
ncbi:hypothetical protein [Rhizobium leguminosarum]|uniref:hypothetical protein n=1 Tax=Rhizobium leguminosarum TaxID=384 RepID=UPI001441F641|nr:hypothetical protein [Rhizobium leguminosarum]NKJ77818.1 hypothetical protein [Rhizobium leguminosarum bv. viciae]